MRSLCFALLFFTRVVCAQEPVQVDSNEAYGHRLGLPRAIHTASEPSLPAADHVTLQVIVDTEGNVESAKAIEGPKDFFAAAESIEGKRTFKPFQRDGVAARATFVDSVSIFPLETWGQVQVPFPEIKDWATLKMRLKRTRCYGPCPIYSVEVRGDGTVDFDGVNFVSWIGHRSYQISQQSVKDLVAECRKTNYFSLRDEYAPIVKDSPSYTTTIEFDGTSKSVREDEGMFVGMPEVVKELEDSIDRVAGTDKWVTRK